MILTSMPARAQVEPWQKEWAVERGFSLNIDTAGYEFPSAIAFVPNPGESPKDPLYFVTELQGAVKVVTNDRTVYTFAEDFSKLKPPASTTPGKVSEMGVSGICLDPKSGYVFVAFVYEDSKGDLRHNIIRFDTQPKTFALKPTGQKKFTEVFSDQPASGSHMIGPMLVHQNSLFVCVGDAQVPYYSQSLEYLNGKVLRMTLDGKPFPDNPFRVDDNPKVARNYIWAKGFRNPFGITEAEGKIFITDVGPNTDRFTQIKRGRDYGYDGSDWSIASHADVSFTPSTSPVQLVYLEPDTKLLPDPWRGQFYIVTSGLQGAEGPSDHGEKALLRVDYNFEHDAVIGRPYEVMKYVGNGFQNPVSIAKGPDGLYIVLLHPNAEGQTAVMRLSHKPSAEHPIQIDPAVSLMRSKGCIGCHRPGIGAPAPPLDPNTLASRLIKRLNSKEYIQQSIAVDKRQSEPFVSFREEREKVRQADGYEKAHLWVKYRLLEPRFDNPDAIMPNLQLTSQEAALLADHLVRKPPELSVYDLVKNQVSAWIPYPRLRHLAIFFAIGLISGILTSAISVLLIRWLRHRQPQRS